MNKPHILFIAIFFFCGVFPSSAGALIIEDRPFSFGALVVTDNSNVYSMRIHRNGNITPIDPAIIQVGSVNSAQYTITSFPPNTNLNVSFLTGALVGPNSNQFNVTAYDFDSNPRTDGSGSEVLNVGSTLTTSGNGLPYIDGSYSGSMVLDVTF